MSTAASMTEFAPFSYRCVAKTSGRTSRFPLTGTLQYRIMVMRERTASSDS